MAGLPDTDFVVSLTDGVQTFAPTSERARSWLAASGKGAVNEDGTLVAERDTASAATFQDLLDRKGFKCSSPEGAEIRHRPVRGEPGGWTFGCSAVLIAAAVLPLIGAVYVVGRVFGAGVAAIAIGIVAALAMAGALLAWMQSDATKAFRKKLASLNFQPDALEWCGAGTLIAIDKSSRRLAVQASGTLMLRDFDSLLGVEIEEDGATIQKTDRGSQLGGALLGTMVAGPAGLIVGGLSGTKRTENRVRAVTLNIFTRDTTHPTLKLSFLNDPSGAMTTSETYKAARLQAQEWYSRIRAVTET